MSANLSEQNINEQAAALSALDKDIMLANQRVRELESAARQLTSVVQKLHAIIKQLGELQTGIRQEFRNGL